MLAEHDAVGRQADVLRLHDLVGLAVLQHAMLVDARFVREGVGADDRLVARRRRVGDLRERPAGGHDLRGVDAGRDAVEVGAGVQRHDDVLERAIARPLADAVDGAFDLPRAAADGGERIGDRHAEIVVAMGGEDDVLGHDRHARSRKRNRS